MKNIRVVEGIMYGKFNNRNRSMSLLKADKKGIVVINKPFKEVLDEVVNDSDNVKVINNTYIDHTEELEITLLWQDAIHKNYIKTRGEM